MTDLLNARRARWRSRRGLLELDLLLAPFVEGHLDDLDATTCASYVALLANEDLDIFDWLQAKSPPPGDLASIVAFVRAKVVPRV